MFYVGVIENNVDELKIGRCQVRIFGKHDNDRTDFPTEDLPWAQVLFNGPNISEECNFNIPNNGDFVIVSFLDPEEQLPIILGSVPKILKVVPDFNDGFSDPNGNYPDSNHVNESSISRLARNENIDLSIIQDKKDNKKTGVSCGPVSFDKPETQYDTMYPINKVINTKYHVIELDDTPGKERVHIYHKTGTSTEIHPNGDEVEIVKAKKFLIIESDKNSYIGGNYNINIEGDENKKIGGTQTETIDTKQITASTDIILEAGGNVEITAGGNVEITASGQVKVTGSVIMLN